MTIFSNEVLPGSEWNTQIKKDKYPTDKKSIKNNIITEFQMYMYKCRSHFSFTKNPKRN